MDNLGLIPWGVVTVGVLIAAATDLWKFKVYNLLTIPLALTGVLYHLVTGGIEGLAFSVGGLMLGFFVLIIPYALGGMGAGDVKLLAAIGAWLGVGVTFWGFVIAGIAGGIYALIIMFPNGGFQNIWLRLSVFVYQMRTLTMHLGPEEKLEEVAKGDDRHKRLIPFAALLALALLVLLLVWIDGRSTTEVIAQGRPGR